AMAEIINARIVADGEGEPVTESSLAETYDHLQRCDPATDIVVAEANGEVVGYARTGWNDVVATGHREFWVANGALESVSGLERTLIDWAIQRAIENAASHTHDPKRLRAFAAVGGARHALFLDAGFETTGFSATMVRTALDDVPDRALPAGLVTRPVVHADLRAIWEADVDAFRDDDDFVEQTEEDWERFGDEAARGVALWKVAWDGEDVVGQVRTRVAEGEAARIGRRRAWTEEISTRRDWRRRGVASALITASLRQLAELGFDEAALSADIDAASGSFRLYESLGYREVIRHAMMVRPL
ncbi:MAG TPA: GNAT family N-acetyltransferase, partial [Desertimonas sp.]|nr:GNAT family N-acetyltransferase [Desertimonas sp.]